MNEREITKNFYKLKLKQRIELVLKENGLSQTQAAKKLGISQQAFNQKTNGGSWRFIDVEELVEMMGFEIVFVRKNLENKLTLKDDQTK